MGINTGIGGFEINGKVHTFDVGDPSDPGIDPVNPDSGDLTVDNSVKDVSKKTKLTLADYLKSSTSNNAFPITGEYKEVVITTEKGVPSPISTQLTNDPQFADPLSATGVTSTNDPAVTLGGLSKGKTSPQNINGNQLLPSVTKDKLPEPIKTYTTTVLANNRFTDASRSSPNQMLLDHPDRLFNPTFRSPEYGDLSAARLAQVGVSLSLRASQELNAATRGNNPSSAGSEAGALLPGLNQLGATRVDTIVLEARDALRDLTNEEVPEGNFISIADGSWGALNNVSDPFSGIQSTGMIAMSVVLTSAVVLLFEGLGALLGLIQGSSVGSARNLSGRYVSGRSTVTKQSDPNAFPPDFPPDIGALLGIRSTVYPLGAALKEGTAAFFGVDMSSAGSTVTSGLNSAVGSPGFNVVVARTIVRSGIFVVDAFKKAFSSSNFVAGVKNVLSIIDIIRTSKVIAAINVFAMIGDSLLMDPSDQYAASDAIPEEPKKRSRIDSFDDSVPGSTVQKNRLRGKLKLAWSSNRAPAMYLVPDSILTMQLVDSKLGGFKGPIGLVDPDSKSIIRAQTESDQLSNGARLPYDDGTSDGATVKNLEDALDAEYMPFYFHDLRTNEIISFHAFMASLSDGFTAGWENTDGYGRVDPVKVYKNTSRRIEMSFYVASTSEQDFDDMWMKINKLVTLVYPQYTKGRILDDADSTRFVQPFSQLIGASPLVRIRLGDLIRSNYSRFALARLFGAASNEMKLDGTEIRFENAADKLEKYRNDAFLLFSKVDATNKFTLTSPGEWPLAPAKTGGGTGAAAASAGSGPSNPKQAPTLKIDAGDVQYFEFQVTAYDLGVCTIKPMLLTVDQLVLNGMNSVTASDRLRALELKYKRGPLETKVIGDDGYKVPGLMLKPTAETLRKLYEKDFAGELTNIDKLSEFLDPEKNAIVKSFRSTQGKGLAGAIETLNFDWYDKVTWDDRLGHKAPKICKVTLSFSPIHDISPGLDHMGYNRAPVYPVGGAMGTPTERGKAGR